jgi:hypothetical protein
VDRFDHLLRLIEQTLAARDSKTKLDEDVKRAIAEQAA